MASQMNRSVPTLLTVMLIIAGTDGILQFQRRSQFPNRMNQYLWSPSPYQTDRGPRHYQRQAPPRAYSDPWERQLDPWQRRSDSWGRPTDRVDSWGRSTDQWDKQQADQWGLQTDQRRGQKDRSAELRDQWGRGRDQWGDRMEAPRHHHDSRRQLADHWRMQSERQGSQTNYGHANQPVPHGRHQDNEWQQTDHRRHDNNNAQSQGRQRFPGGQPGNAREVPHSRPVKQTPVRPKTVRQSLPQRPTPQAHPATEITRLKVTGYDPEDIQLSISEDGPIEVKGLHQCDCQENCFEREFERKIRLPNTVDRQTLRARVSEDNYLIITGVHQRSQGTDATLKRTIPVERTSRRSLERGSPRNCAGTRRGLKLKKMDAETRQVVEDVPVDVVERRYEGEVDNDGVTIEVNS